MNKTDIFMAPGKWVLDMVLNIFEIHPDHMNLALYTLFAFLIALGIWLRSLQVAVDMLKASLSSPKR